MAAIGQANASLIKRNPTVSVAETAQVYSSHLLRPRQGVAGGSAPSHCRPASGTQVTEQLSCGALSVVKREGRLWRTCPSHGSGLGGSEVATRSTQTTGMRKSVLPCGPKRRRLERPQSATGALVGSQEASQSRWAWS